jgi:hypothetical protein
MWHFADLPFAHFRFAESIYLCLKLCANPQIHIFSLFNYWLKMPNTEKNNQERGKEGTCFDN